MNIKINRNQLKYIAIIAMIIDHIGWTFVDTLSVGGQIMHFFGRLTGPIMAFMLYEGYMHTKNVKKYAIRLGIFALVSWPAYSYYETRQVFAPQFGVIFTLFLGLLVLWMWDKGEMKKWLKVLLTVVACLLSLLGDWPIFDILWPLFLFLYRDEPKKQWTSFAIVIAVEVILTNLLCIGGAHPYRQLFQIGAFMVLPILMFCYNGKPGKKNAFNKWFFYIFYPLHLVILSLLAIYVFK